MHYAARYAYFYLDFCIDIFSLDWPIAFLFCTICF